ncbi:hypothetical protein ACFE04_025123 [Oxalis oulophora]
MTAGDISRVHLPQEASQRLTRALWTAVSEWLLMVLLFVDSIFSYLITKFACHCELQPPCLLCSRLDHILSKKNMKKYYWDLVCLDHKLEISSSVFCHAHNKLVDVHGICESCLFSFATINKSNSETYRLLVGKLGEESEITFDRDLLLESRKGGHLGVRHCSCCNQPLVSRGPAQKLVQTKSFDTDEPLSSAADNNQENFMNSPSAFVKETHHENTGLDHPLSHFSYSELKITSDTESEQHFSDEEDLAVHRVQLNPRVITLSDDPALEKLIDPISVPEPSHFQIMEQPGNAEPDAATHRHGFEEIIGCEQVDHNVEPSTTPAESIFSEDVHLPSNDGESPIILEEESIIPSTIMEEPLIDTSKESEYTYSVLPPIIEEIPDDVSKDGELSSLNEVVITSEISERDGSPRPTEVVHPSSGEYNEVCKVSREPPVDTAIETNNASSGYGLLSPTSLDLTDAYRLAISNNARQSSGTLLEQYITKDSSKVSEDLKQFLTQLSVSRGFELMNDMISPRVSLNGDDFKTSDLATSPGLRMLQKFVSLERNESGLSLDGSIVSEIEGENVVDRLKRQVDHDRRLLRALYKELEEERNSATISANQAMAMISRLQAEKAAVQMEAVQNLRVMEEQAEYDMEAFNQVNDLLSEKEKEIQDLEAELEFYRNNSTPIKSNSDLKVRDITIDHLKGNVVEDRENFLTNSDIKEQAHDNVTDSLLDFEDERLYISQRLEKLEKMLDIFSGNDLHSNIVDQGYSGNKGESSSELNDICTGESEVNSLVKEESQENTENGCSEPSNSRPHEEINLASVGNEVSELKDKLEALEADWNFLEHSINSLRNGDEGLRFVQEIASHLQELRSIGTRRRNETVAS